MSLEQIVPAIALIAVLFLVLPGFISSNSNKKLFFKTIQIILFISLVFFIFNNITKYKNYIDRHGLTWPNLNAEFIDR